MRLVSDREQAQVDALGSARIDAAHDILVDLLSHEGDHGSCALADVDQCSVQSHVRVDLVLLHALGPEAVTAAADIPVGHLVHECLQSGSRLGDPVLIQVRIRVPDHSVHAGKQPLIHDAELVIIQLILCGIKAIDIRIQSIERIGVPQSSEELALAFLNCLV